MISVLYMLITLPFSEEEVKLGAFYDPRVLEDYGGPPFFQQTTAKLVQLDIRDINNKLIPPWKQYAELRTGTLVLVLATVHVYAFNDRKVDLSICYYFWLTTVGRLFSSLHTASASWTNLNILFRSEHHLCLVP